MKYILPVLLLLSTLAEAQTIRYSEPDRTESRRIDFEVIGKVGANNLVYKQVRNRSYVVAYDNEMKQVSKVEQEYVPDDRLINADFFPYAEHAWMVYQYQRKNVVYCLASKIDHMGKKTGEPITLDTTHIGWSTSNKIYSVVSSEDRSKIMLFKINSRNKRRYVLTTLLHNAALELQKRTTIPIEMEDRDDDLDEFAVDNDGDFVFTKFTRGTSDNVASSLLFWKPAMSDSMKVVDLQLEQDRKYLDEPHLKVDNANKRYFLTSFYYKQRRGNVEGFYFFVWDKVAQRTALNQSVVLNEELRREAKGSSGVKTAFNDYFIRQVILRKDGGFLIGAEAYYTTTRGGGFNRWDYLYGGFNSFNSFDYYLYNPGWNSWYHRNRFNNNQSTRHHADNITLLSFDRNGKPEWTNVITKEQFDDEMGDKVSYQLVNTGGQLHFLFNQEERRLQLLNDYTLGADGKMNRNPTLKGLDRGYEFLPRFGKQVSARSVIIPCYYRNLVCFAKIDF